MANSLKSVPPTAQLRLSDREPGRLHQFGVKRQKKKPWSKRRPLATTGTKHTSIGAQQDQASGSSGVRRVGAMLLSLALFRTAYVWPEHNRDQRGVRFVMISPLYPTRYVTVHTHSPPLLPCGLSPTTSFWKDMPCLPVLMASCFANQDDG